VTDGIVNATEKFPLIKAKMDWVSVEITVYLPVEWLAVKLWDRG
jgi:hypothetical protein